MIGLVNKNNSHLVLIATMTTAVTAALSVACEHAALGLQFQD